ncbi:uncharacterized protein K452DRAFT_214271, partial [Aplosporella prunicola CBS 121167]
IALKDFTELAEYICNADNPVVPRRIMDALTRMISVRKRISHRVSAISRDLPYNAEAVSRYLSFIKTLEGLKEILSLRKSVEELSTSFAGLHVEEPSTSSFQVPAAPTPPSENEPKYCAELQSGIEEAFLALCLLLKEYRELRDVIANTWTLYKEGNCSLITASITTDTALKTARALENDAKDLFDKHGGFEQMLQILYCDWCASCKQSPDFQEQPMDAMNFNMYDVSDKFFYPTFVQLKNFCLMVNLQLDAKQLPVFKPGFIVGYKPYDPSRDRSKLSSREKYQQDEILMMEIFAEFALICKTTDTLSAQDELTLALRMLFKNKRMTLMVLFATQVFFDTHHILKQDASKGFWDLQRIARQIDSSLQENFEFHKSLSLKNESWPPRSDLLLEGIRSRINHWVKSDKLQKMAWKSGRAPGSAFVWLKGHPAFCGLMTFSIQAMFQVCGVVFANAWGSIMSAAHIYNAARQESVLTRVWNDMEILFRLQNRDEMLGGTPKSRDEYLKQFYLHMGYSATPAALRDTSNTDRQSPKMPLRMLHEQTPMSWLFEHRYCRGLGTSTLLKDHCALIIMRSKWNIDEATTSSFFDMQFFFAQPAAVKQLIYDQTVYKQSKPLRYALLEHLRTALQNEMPALCFDYFALHRVSWTLLQRINSACAPQLRDLYGQDYLTDQRTLPDLVGFIFAAAAGNKEFAG